MKDLLSQSRELGFIRGLAFAQKLASARGDYAFAVELGKLAIQSDTYILANTKSETETAGKVA